MKTNKKLPVQCPACACIMKVKQMYCDTCDTLVSGLYDLPPLSRLSEADQKFILDFVKTSGSLKLMAEQMGVSYPSVRSTLDEVIERVKKIEL